MFTDAAIQACLTLKALFGLPLRQTTVMVTSLLDKRKVGKQSAGLFFRRLAGLD